MSLNSLFLTLKGGYGSGNIGHAGIPGHRGGSAPSGLMNQSEFDSLIKDYNETFRKEVKGREHLYGDSAFEFPSNVKAWKGSQGKPSKPCRSKSQECHYNALDYVKKNPGASLGIGYFIDPSKKDSKSYISAGDHSWVIENGKVVDPTLGKTNMIYVGYVIPHEKVKQIKDKDSLSDAIFQKFHDIPTEEKSRKKEVEEIVSWLQ